MQRDPHVQYVHQTTNARALWLVRRDPRKAYQATDAYPSHFRVIGEPDHGCVSLVYSMYTRPRMLVAGAQCDTELNLRKIRMIHYATRHYDSLCDTKPRMLAANDLVTDAHSLAPEARPLLSHPSLCSGVTPALRIFWRAERGVAAGTLHAVQKRAPVPRR